MSSIRRSFGFSAANKYTQFVIFLAFNVLIARLLTPAEIGVYAIAAVVAGVAHMLRDFGISQYLVREPDLTEQKIRAAFTLMLLIGWTLGAGLALAAGPLAGFYGEPELATVLRVQSLCFLVVPFGTIGLSLLRRNLRFGSIYPIDLLSSLAHIATGISLAVAGFGPLSLAWASVAASTGTTVGAVIAQRGGLGRRPTLKGVRDIVRFGMFVSGSTLLGTVTRDIPELIIGKFLGVTQLAYFNKAMLPGNVFNDFVMGALNPVILPAFARKIREGDYVRDALYGMACLAALVIPGLLLTSFLAKWVLMLVFGPQWLAASTTMSILALSAAVQGAVAVAPQLLTALGEVRAPFLVQLAVGPLRLVLVLLALPYGIEAIAGGWLLSSAASGLLMLWQLCRHSPIGFRDIVRAIGPAVIIAGPSALIPAGLVWVADPPLTTGNAFLVLSGAGLLFALIAWAGFFVLRHPLYKEVSGLAGRLALRFTA